MTSLPALETLKVSLDKHIAHVELNRPDKANAMNGAMWDELETCFNWADATPEVRVVVLSGNGKHFCAGIDLAIFGDIAEQSGSISDRARVSEQLRQFILRLQGNLTAIERCRKPVLAAIHSSCIGGGVDMISCCDMRYCSEDARFSIKEIDIGMTADVGTLQRLPNIIPDGIVRELAYTGRNMLAAEAERVGLVNRVFADREVMLEQVMALAAEIAGKNPLAIRGSKEMILYTRDHSVADGLNYIATWNAGLLSTDDLMKTVAAQMSGETVEYDN